MAKKPIKRPRDPIALAKLIGDIAIGQVPNEIEDNKNPKRIEAGRLGGTKGGIARAEKLSKEQRVDIGKKGAAARWSDSDDN